MNDKVKIALLVILAIVVLANPMFLLLTIFAVALYFFVKSNVKFGDEIEKIKKKYNTSSNKDSKVIDTEAEVISSTVVKDDDSNWNATKEYK